MDLELTDKVAVVTGSSRGLGLASAAALDVTHVIFGDIMFDAHRAWNERVCAAHGLTAVLPIWNGFTMTG